MAKYDHIARRLNRAMCTSRCGRREGEAEPSIDKDGSIGMSALMKPLHGMPARAHARDITIFLAPYVNSYKRYCVGMFRADQGVWSADNRTAGSGCAARAQRGCGSNAASAAPISTPISPVPPCWPPALDGVENKMELEPELRGDMYGAEGGARNPQDACARRPSLRRGSEFLLDRFCAEVVALRPCGALGDFRARRVVTHWEVQRGLGRA